MDKDQDIEKLFQDTFDGFEVTPPAEIKLEINQKLGFGKSYAGRKIWFFGIAIAFLGLVSLTAYLFFFSTSTKSKDTLTSLQTPTSIIDDSNENESPVLDEELAKAGINDRSETNTNKKETKTNNSLSKKQADKKTVSSSKNSIDNQNYTEQNPSKKQQQPTGNKANKKTKKKNSATKASDVYRKTKKLPKLEQPNKILALEGEKNPVGTEKEIDTENIAVNSDSGNAKPNLSKEDDINKENIKNDAKTEINENKSSTSEKTIEKTVSDSTKNEVTPPDSPQNEKPGDKKGKPNFPLMLSLKTGTSFTANSFSGSNAEQKVNESSLFNVQLEATYSFGQNIGVSSGVNYYRSLQNLSQRFSVSEQKWVGTQTQYTTKDTFELIPNDSLPPDTIFYTITDSLDIPVYETVTTDSTEQSSFVSSSISIPFLFSYSFSLTDRLNLDLLGGGTLRFQQIKFRENNNPLNQQIMYNKMGISLCLKTHLRYQWDHFGVSVSTNFGYDFGSPGFVSSQRKRFLVDLGLGVHYRF